MVLESGVSPVSLVNGAGFIDHVRTGHIDLALTAIEDGAAADSSHRGVIRVKTG